MNFDLKSLMVPIVLENGKKNFGEILKVDEGLLILYVKRNFYQFYGNLQPHKTCDMLDIKKGVRIRCQILCKNVALCI